MAIGDDYTDEDIFQALPKSAFTIKVGHDETAARYQINSVKDVNNLLKKLIKS